MITYFKMKRNEWKVKAQFYKMLAYVIDNQKDIITSLEKLFAALKDDQQANQPLASETTE